MFGLFDSRRREARRLNRDAAVVVEGAVYGTRPRSQRAVAEAIATHLSQAHERGGSDPSRYQPILDHFRALHREARRRRDDRELTTHTLLLIYLRAEMLGDEAVPARETIDEFVAMARAYPDDPDDGTGLIA